jgi:predicted metal-dependent peptidase
MTLTTLQRIKRAIINIQQNNSFFAYLLLYLKFHEVTDKNYFPKDNYTMAVDVQGNVYYFKDWVDKLTDTELRFIILHELLHLVLLHLLRGKNKNPQIFNISADICVNSLLKENKSPLPRKEIGGLIPNDKQEIQIGPVLVKNCNKRTAENIYEELMKNLPQVEISISFGDGSNGNSEKGDKDGKGDGSPNESNKNSKGLYKGAFDIHITAANGKLSEKQRAEIEAEWKDRIHQALTSSQMRGDVPAGIERLIGELHKETINWKVLLRRYITQSIPSNYTWSRPSRRSISSGIYFPDVLCESIKVGIGIDCSGSIDNSTLNDFLSEIVGMARSYAGKIDMTLWTHDIDVSEKYEVKNGKIEKIKKLKIVGGGGTSHTKIFEVMKKELKNCKCAVFLTDGYSDLNEINFEKYPFQKIFVITRDGSDSQLNNKRCLVVKIK